MQHASQFSFSIRFPFDPAISQLAMKIIAHQHAIARYISKKHKMHAVFPTMHLFENLSHSMHAGPRTKLRVLSKQLVGSPLLLFLRYLHRRRWLFHGILFSSSSLSFFSLGLLLSLLSLLRLRCLRLDCPGRTGFLRQM